MLDGPNDKCVELEELVAKVIDDGISVAAVDDNDKLIGVVINGLVRRVSMPKLHGYSKELTAALKRNRLLKEHAL